MHGMHVISNIRQIRKWYGRNMMVQQHRGVFNLEELCEQFANIFGDKIQKIRSNLVEVPGQFTPVPDSKCEHILTEFSEKR